jgi:hypothetical protein
MNSEEYNKYFFENKELKKILKLKLGEEIKLEEVKNIYYMIILRTDRTEILFDIYESVKDVFRGIYEYSNLHRYNRTKSDNDEFIVSIYGINFDNYNYILSHPAYPKTRFWWKTMIDDKAIIDKQLYEKYIEILKDEETFKILSE